MTDEEIIAKLNTFYGKEALAIIKPVLIAQGMREAKTIITSGGNYMDIVRRAQELDPQ